MNLGVLDYGAGNLRSVLNAFAAIQHQAMLVTQPEHFATIDLLVFPGQGAFGDSVRILKETGLWEPLRAWLRAKNPTWASASAISCCLNPARNVPAWKVWRWHQVAFENSMRVMG